MENNPWKQTVGTLITAVWIYTLAGIFGSIISAIDTIQNGVDFIESLTGGGSGSFISFWQICDYACTLLVVIGYFLFYRSLDRFEKLQLNSDDTCGAHKVKVSYILLIIAAVMGVIPIIGKLLRFILLIISYVKLLGGYRDLKRSEVLPQQARDGFARLYSCSVWLLVFGLIGYIPAIGPMAEGIASIVIFFLVLSGWRMVQCNAPELTDGHPRHTNTSSTGASVLGSPASSPVRNYTVEKLEEIVSSSGMYKTELVEAARHELEVRHKAEGLKDKVAEFDDAKITEILSNPGNYVDELVYACNLEKATRSTERERRLQKEREEARLKAEKEAEARKQHVRQVWRKNRLYVYAGAAIAVIAGLVIYLASDTHHYARGMRLWKADNVEKAFAVLSKMNNTGYKHYSNAKYHVYLYNMFYAADTSAAVTALKAAAEDNTGNAWQYCPTAVRTYADYLTNGSMPSYVQKDLVKAASLYSNSPSTDDQLKAGALYYEGGALFKAKEIFEAHSGSGTAKGYLGMMHLYGLGGLEQDFNTAYDYLMKAPDELPFVVHKGDLTLYLRKLKHSTYKYITYDIIKEANKYYDMAAILDPENEEYIIRQTVTDAVCKAYEEGPRSSTSWEGFKTIYHSKYWHTYTFTAGDSHGYYCGVVSDIRHGQTPNGWGAFSWDNKALKITKYSNLKETDSYGIAIYSNYKILVGKIENDWNLSEGVVTRWNGTKYRVE